MLVSRRVSKPEKNNFYRKLSCCARRGNLSSKRGRSLLWDSVEIKQTMGSNMQIFIFQKIWFITRYGGSTDIIGINMRQSRYLRYIYIHYILYIYLLYILYRAIPTKGYTLYRLPYKSMASKILFAGIGSLVYIPMMDVKKQRVTLRDCELKLP